MSPSLWEMTAGSNSLGIGVLPHAERVLLASSPAPFMGDWFNKCFSFIIAELRALVGFGAPWKLEASVQRKITTRWSERSRVRRKYTGTRLQMQTRSCLVCASDKKRIVDWSGSRCRQTVLAGQQTTLRSLVRHAMKQSPRTTRNSKHERR